MALLLPGCFFVVLGVALKFDVCNASASSSCATAAPSDASEACPTDKLAYDVGGTHDSASWLQLGQPVLSGTAVRQEAVLTGTAEHQDNNLDSSDDGDGGANGGSEALHSNYFCISEGKSFATSAQAKEYFHTECVDRYGYENALCSGLADKVFEKFKQDNSASWKPDTDVCAKIDSLLSADAARRLELGLDEVAASAPTTPPSAMLQRSTRSHSGSASRSFDEVLRAKDSATPLPTTYR